MKMTRMIKGAKFPLKAATAVILAATVALPGVGWAASCNADASDVTVNAVTVGNPLRLRYDEARRAGDAAGDVWQKRTLPIGNGDMGANVYGEVQTEHLTFNEKTLWTGVRVIPARTTTAATTSRRVPTALRSSASSSSSPRARTPRPPICATSSSVTRKATALSGWGDIYLKYTDLGNGSASDYERSLDLTTGIAGVEFDAGGRHIAREFFASHPDKVVVGRLEASGKAGVTVEITFRPSRRAPRSAHRATRSP